MNRPDHEGGDDEQLALFALKRFGLFNPHQPIRPKREIEHIYPDVLGGPPTPRTRITLCPKCYDLHGIDPCPAEAL